MIRILILIAFFSSTGVADQQQTNSKGWPCARKIDPSYIQVTEGSGGQILMLDPSEARESMVLMESRLNGNEETVFRASGDLLGEQEFNITVDSTIESVAISSFVQCMKGIQLYGPDSQEILGAEEGVKDHRYISGRVMIIEKPQQGKWKVRFSGSGYFSVLAEGRTALTLELRFVEAGGRPGHEGYFPIQRPPRLMREEQLSASLDGPVQSAVFHLVSRDGAIRQKLELTETSKTTESTEFFGAVQIPVELFRIYVEGINPSGLPFERYFPALFHAE